MRNVPAFGCYRSLLADGFCWPTLPPCVLVVSLCSPLGCSFVSVCLVGHAPYGVGVPRTWIGGTVWVDLGIIPYFYLDSISLSHAFTYTLGRLAFCEH